jgi:signal transduction histidine kinase
MLNNFAFGIAIGLILMSLIVLFCVLLVKLYIHKIKNYTKVIYEKDLNFQKTLNSTIIETQEQVLNNISQDLHDDAGQQLTAINFQLENLKLDLPKMNAVLEPISESVSNLAKSIRSISHSLNNQLLTRQDLFKAISAEVERLQKNIPITITVQLEQDNRKVFTSNEKIVIYRIFQEIINNILKHAKATEVTIVLKANPDFKMTVQDNGKGFDYEATRSNHNTIGLQNMIHRADIIGYQIEVASAPGKGTTITLLENK